VCASSSATKHLQPSYFVGWVTPKKATTGKIIQFESIRGDVVAGFSLDANMKKTPSSRKETSERDKISSLFKTRHKSKGIGEYVLKNLKWVIFPGNKWIKRWDMLVLGALFLLAFILPYQIGVSGGITILYHIPWFAFNVFLNAIFFVDTFLYFFRAYYTKSGHLVLNLRTIRRRYLRTYFLPNFVSVLPYTVTFYSVGMQHLDVKGEPTSTVYTYLTFITFASLLKLIRLVRAKTILSSSDTVTSFQMKRNSQVLELWKYVLLMVVVSHWFACIWSLVAFIEADSLGVEQLMATPNWIAGWYSDNSTNGGLNPLGWDQAIDRYVLSLFWAIQTLTSIGYGNIAPVTRAEYFVACVLQLCAGVMWSYVIGALVGVAAGMQVRAESYRTRIDQANKFIHEFADPDELSDDDDETVATFESKVVARQIRKYIHKQYTVSKGETCLSTVPSYFPVFDTLTPELQRASSVLLHNKYLKAVPYLSSRYMSQEDQSIVAMQCISLDFNSGEIIDTDNAVGGIGRGVFVFRRGCAFSPLHKISHGEGAGLVTPGMTSGAGKVLLADDNKAARGKLHFLTFSQVVFIPRKAIIEALKKSEKAWKECGRWIYLRTLLIAKLNENQQTKEITE